MTAPIDRTIADCPLGRRTVLRTALRAAAVTAVAVTAGAAVAGCGGDDDPAGAGGDRGGPAAGGAAATPTANLPGGALARAADVPVGGGVVVGQVVIAQPTDGVFKAYDARCPHMGVTVNAPGADGVILCTGHRARFQSSDGSVLTGPADRALSGIPVKVDGEHIVRIQ